MRHTLICTVGTSLKVNSLSSSDLAPGNHFRAGNSKALSLWLSGIDPAERVGGAELNSITSIVKKGLLRERLFLHLLVSDTEDGRFVGKVLTDYYGRHDNPFRFENVDFAVLEGLNDSSPKAFQSEGLRNLVRAVAETVRRHGPESVLINATGGYKAQISFAGMIGQALEIPVCYLFERFSEVIVLPPQPVSLDLGFWMDNIPVFFQLAEEGLEENPADKEERFASLVDSIEVDGRKLVALSAVGQLFHETFRYRFRQQRQKLLPADCGVAPGKKVIKYEDGNEGKHKGLAAHLEKLRECGYVVRIYTHYFNPGLPLKNYFRPSAKGEVSSIEGGYSDGKATTKFDVVTTGKTKGERDAVLADLNERIQ